MPELAFRRATKTDLPAIVAMLADDALGATRESPDDLTPYQKVFELIDADPTIDLIVAELDGKVVGTAQLAYVQGLSRKGSMRADIEAVRIDASLRGGGHGSALIEHCIQRAEEHGAAIIQLTSDATRIDAHRFYLHLGFVQSHFGFKMKLPRA